MSTTSAISSNPTRNNGATVLNAGNIDNTNVTNAPGVSILGLGADKGSIRTPYNALIRTVREDFQRGALGATVWGSGVGWDNASIPTLQNLSGSSGIYSPTVGSAANGELLYLGKTTIQPCRVNSIFYSLDGTHAEPGSPGLIYKVNPSGYIWAQVRQSTGGIGRMHRISYALNAASGAFGIISAMTHVASGLQTTHDFDLNRPDGKHVVKIGMGIDGSGVTLYVNDVASISGDVPAELTNDATFVGVRSSADSNPDCNYDAFEIFENLSNDLPNLERSVPSATPIFNGSTVLGDNKTIRDTLDNNIPAHRQKLSQNTITKGGQTDEPTALPYYDEFRNDSLGTGVTIDRANQSAARYLEGGGAAEVPTTTSYEPKN